MLVNGTQGAVERESPAPQIFSGQKRPTADVSAETLTPPNQINRTA